MFTITETTLSSIDASDIDPKIIINYCNALLDFGVDTIEMTPDIFTLLADEIDAVKILVSESDSSAFYQLKNIGGIVFSKDPTDTDRKKILEVPIDEFEREYIFTWDKIDEVRLIGTEQLFLKNYRLTFKKLLKYSPKPLSLCTKHAGYASTALMVEWALCGGKNIVVSYMGGGGYAPLEEVVLSLLINGYDLPNINTSKLAMIGKIWHQLTGKKIPNHKPIAGKHIFHVESGVHVNGILKNSCNYEPFHPEEIGTKRKIILGKHSGRSSILNKLHELDLNVEQIDLDILLNKVKEASIDKGNITNKEFLKIISEEKGCNRYAKA